jgi:hypothetical protein
MAYAAMTSQLTMIALSGTDFTSGRELIRNSLK